MAIYIRKATAVAAERTVPGTALKRIPDGTGGFVEYSPGDWILRFEDSHVESCPPARFAAEYEILEAEPEVALAALVPEVTTEPQADGDDDEEEPS